MFNGRLSREDITTQFGIINNAIKLIQQNISGGQGITVQNDNTTLSTSAKTLKFVGSGVEATGDGEDTKTITIEGITVQNEVESQYKERHRSSTKVKKVRGRRNSTSCVDSAHSRLAKSIFVNQTSTPENIFFWTYSVTTSVIQMSRVVPNHFGAARDIDPKINAPKYQYFAGISTTYHKWNKLQICDRGVVQKNPPPPPDIHGRW